MNMSKRVKMCREYLDYSQEAIAELIGISQPSYQRLEKGGIANPKFLDKLATIFKTSPQWLKYGSGTPPNYLNFEHVPENKVPLLAWNQVELWTKTYSLEQINKESVFQVGQNGVGDPLRGSHLVTIREKKNDKQFALRVKGDSMTSLIPGKRTFLEGETIYIDPGEHYKDGDFVIAIQKGAPEALFKQYIVDGNKQLLRSLNTQLQPIPVDDSIEIVGKVVEHLDVLI